MTGFIYVVLGLAFAAAMGLIALALFDPNGQRPRRGQWAFVLLALSLMGCQFGGVSPKAREAMVLGEQSLVSGVASYDALEATYHRDTLSLQDQLRRALLKNKMLELGADGLTPEEADEAIAKDAQLTEQYRAAHARVSKEAAKGRLHFKRIGERLLDARVVFGAIERRRKAEDEVGRAAGAAGSALSKAIIAGALR